MVHLVHFTTVRMMGDLSAPWTFLPHNTSIYVGDHMNLLFYWTKDGWVGPLWGTRELAECVRLNQ